MKTTSKLVIVALGMLLGTSARAQLNIPVSNVSLEFSGVGAVTLHIGSPGGTTENVLPTPFLISGLPPITNSWLCMDPLQRIYYNGSGLPAGSQIHYASFNPSDFDLWTPGAPGLTSTRVQDMADLFHAYWTLPDTSLNSAALQLAVWEIANEFTANGYDLTTGQFTAYNNATEVNLAQSMLNSLTNPLIHNHGSVGSLSFLIDGTTTVNGQLTLVQDLVGYNPTGIGLIPVPEPSTYGLGAVFGLGLIAAIRRRRRAQA